MCNQCQKKRNYYYPPGIICDRTRKPCWPTIKIIEFYTKNSEVFFSGLSKTRLALLKIIQVDAENKILLKCAGPAELALIYNVNVRTIRRWLEPHMVKVGKLRGKLYTPAQVRIIYQCLGMPGAFFSE